MDFDDGLEPVIPAAVGRKRKASIENHQRGETKRARHSGEGKHPKINCGHRATASRPNVGMCHADKLSDEDVAFNFTKMYKNATKVDQDKILLRLSTISKCSRVRVSADVKKKAREVTVKYCLLSCAPPHHKIPVCKATFLSVLGVSKDRVSRVVKYFSQHGEARPECRGGTRNVDEKMENRQAVVQHVSSFMCKASHYARRGAPGRKYLPSDMSVTKMHRLFQEQNHRDISYSLYYNVFCTSFNLGFGHPAKDCCATCMSSRLRMKDPHLTEEERKAEIVSVMLHRRRARVFYTLLNAVEDTVTVCFDMMQNLSLPKSPIGQTYYSRQLYMYVFGVVVHHGERSLQALSDCHLYVWLENQNRKDSNMTASALDHCLRTSLAEDVQQAGHLRLFSDSCYGQNKNSTMVGMLSSLRSTIFKDVKMECFFPVRGHSFLPVDRVFGRIEQDIRKQDTILLPDKYTNILKKHGSVYVYGKDWESFDHKAAAKALIQSTRSYKISEARVLEIDGKGLGVRTTFSGPTYQHTLLKRGNNWGQYKADPLPMMTTVKAVKKKDIISLLKAIGAPANVEAFYNHALAVTSDVHRGEE
ncbi:uncharacterized protein LOC125266040 [Megalobrama amblycephala]|uniref:uncharacterized protein LOC125251889 n=1 Tax=Megalobrama amblycephala TaxID=75352 RepID=UPI002014047C|nr:uncharacterized protein LOC125251889 [Megalobrama amblycephala]XP_048042483.1 uncharacterized protein LOC125266040 [Megalobrama amblycephala]